MPIMQPKDSLITSSGRWLGGLEVFDEHQKVSCNHILIVALRLLDLEPLQSTTREVGFPSRTPGSATSPHNGHLLYPLVIQPCYVRPSTRRIQKKQVI